jgi:hypothetical protein
MEHLMLQVVTQKYLQLLQIQEPVFHLLDLVDITSIS